MSGCSFNAVQKYLAWNFTASICYIKSVVVMEFSMKFMRIQFLSGLFADEDMHACELFT